MIGERVDGLAADQHVELHQIGLAIAREVVIERGISARDALQPVVKIEHDFVERQFVRQHDARRREVFEFLLHAAFFLAQLQHAAHRILRRDDHRGQDGLLDSLNRSGRRKFRGVVDFQDVARGRRDAILHARRGGDEVDIEFALEPLLNNLHVQQAEKAAAKAESQRDGIFRLVKKCGVVELQLAERIAQQFVVGGVHGE